MPANQPCSTADLRRGGGAATNCSPPWIPPCVGLALPPARKVILSDTVGFVSELPHELVAAFRATLEEVAEADLIVHVRDTAHPDSAAQRADVLAVLAGMVRDGVLDEGWYAEQYVIG